MEKLLRRFGYTKLSGYPQPKQRGGYLWITPQGRTVFLKDDGALISFKTFRQLSAEKSCQSAGKCL